MNIHVKKTFYAIGQGCFYSEQIYIGNEVKTIVYDCGSDNPNSPKPTRLDKEILTPVLPSIDYLVISHFHKDHVNGIEELKKHCNIKNVIIPKIDILDIAFYLGSDNTVVELLINPSSYFEGSQIITVNSLNETTDIVDPENIPQNISHKTNLPIIKSNYELTWVLRLYVDKGVFGNNKLKAEDEELIRNSSPIQKNT